MNSIRSRLLLWQISAVLITSVVVAVLSFRLAWSGFNNVRDLGLEQIAQTVMRHDETPAPQPATAPTPTTGEGWLDDEGLDQFVSQIWDNAGTLIYSSLPNVGPPLQAPGHHIVTWQGQSWRLYTLPQASRTVQVAVTTQIRRQHFYDLMPWLLIPLALLITTLGLLTRAGVHRALRPLESMRSDLEQRGPDGLQAIETQGLPVEIAPLAQTLNQLLSRMDTLLTSQRRFLADAAHELNTPLAAVKLQAQLARRVSPEEWPAALDELDAGIERATRLSSQLLQLARLEPDARQPMVGPVQLDELLRQAVSAFSTRAEHLGCDLGLAGAAAVSMNGDPHALRTLVDNLIDNALNHATAPVRIDVSLRAEEHWAVLEVSDTGPGIAPADRQRVMERFVRLAPGDGKGSGLGLSIVREIAEQHGARVALEDTPGGGLTVRVRLPLAGVPPPATA